MHRIQYMIPKTSIAPTIPARRKHSRRARRTRRTRRTRRMSDEPVTDTSTEPAEALPRLDLAQLKAIIEALVFASPEPLTLKMLCKLLSDEPKEDVQAALTALQEDYQRPGGLHLVEVAGGYQITTRPEFND